MDRRFPITKERSLDEEVEEMLKKGSFAFQIPLQKEVKPSEKDVKDEFAKLWKDKQPPNKSQKSKISSHKRTTSFHASGPVSLLNRGTSLPHLKGLHIQSKQSARATLAPEALERVKRQIQLAATALERPVRRTRSFDDLFKHSWDFTPFFWNEKEWKLKKKKHSDSDTLPKEPPLEVLQAQRFTGKSILKVSSEIKEEDEKKAPAITSNATKKKKPPRTVRFTEATKDNESRIIETDITVFEALPFVRDVSDEDDEKKGLLAFETESSLEGNVKKVVVAGTVEKLISRLADQRLPDSDFIKEFFYSYRTIIAPIKLLTLLAERFEFNPPPNATDADLDYHKRYNIVVKLRAVNVIKKWMQNHYYDFMEENRLFNKLRTFIDEKVAKSLDSRWVLQLRVIIQEKHTIPFSLSPDSPLEMIEVTAKRSDSGILFSSYTQKKTTYNMCFWGFQLQNWMVAVIDVKPEDAADIIEKMIQSNIVFSIDPKEKRFKKSAIYRFVNRLGDTAGDPIAPENMSGKPLKFLDIHPLEIARQLCLITHSIFLKITAREMTEFMKAECVLKSYKCPWVDRLYKRVREVAFWVASEIVLCANASQRLTVVRRFLEIAQHCNKFQNYCDLSAIIGGLRLPAVTRLTKTWKALSKKKHGRMYQDLLSVLKTETIRDRIKKSTTPMIPIFDLYIKDLAEICKQPDSLTNGMVNWKKLRQQALIFEEIERTRNGVPYGFKPVAVYQNFLTMDCVILSEHDLMYYSQECEPDSQLV